MIKKALTSEGSDTPITTNLDVRNILAELNELQITGLGFARLDPITVYPSTKHKSYQQGPTRARREAKTKPVLS